MVHGSYLEYACSLVFVAGKFLFSRVRLRLGRPHLCHQLITSPCNQNTPTYILICLTGQPVFCHCTLLINKTSSLKPAYVTCTQESWPWIASISHTVLPSQFMKFLNHLVQNYPPPFHVIFQQVTFYIVQALSHFPFDKWVPPPPSRVIIIFEISIHFSHLLQRKCWI